MRPQAFQHLLSCFAGKNNNCASVGDGLGKFRFDGVHTRAALDVEALAVATRRVCWVAVHFGYALSPLGETPKWLSSAAWILFRPAGFQLMHWTRGGTRLSAINCIS